MFVHLSKVLRIEKKNSLFASQKLIVYCNGSQKTLVFSFHNKGRDAFHDALSEQLRKKNWVITEQKKIPSNVPDRDFTSRAGVAGILKRVESDNVETEKNLKEAFSDLSSLMDKAKEMVELAEKFGEKVKKLESSGEETSQFQDLLINLGISSPVSKQLSGAHFHQQLARQLSDFLTNPLKNQGGLITLTDAFCLYNRARGTDMISPEDMYRACSLFDNLNLNMTLKTFSSNVVVIQLRSFDDAEIVKRVGGFVTNNHMMGVTPVDIANAFSISVVLAKEQLLLAEEKEVVCRDESMEGIRFYLVEDCFPIAV
jgi:ESCRT-II complex subunit VPS36